MTYIPLAQIEPYLPPSSSASVAKPTSQREENQNCYANTILLRTTSDPVKVIAALRSGVATINANLPV